MEFGAPSGAPASVAQPVLAELKLIPSDRVHRFRTYAGYTGGTIKE